MNAQKYCIPSPLLHSLILLTRVVGVLMLLVVSSGCDSSETNPSSDHDATSADVLPDIQEPPADLLAPSQIANFEEAIEEGQDRKSTRLNSSHVRNLVCRLLLEKKKTNKT